MASADTGTRTHRHAAIVSIGDELTRGQALDTNSQWLSDRLMGLGIETVEHVTIPDDRGATAAAFRRLAGACPLVISTGGLGPTPDDLTRHGLADALGDELVTDAGALAALEQRYAARGRTLGEIQKVQACRPSRATMVPNPNGSAPGLRAEVGGADIFCLPGPPDEMRPMFERSVVPALRPDPSLTLRTRLVHMVGLPEGEAAARLGALLDRARNPLVGITVAGPVLTCRVRYAGGLRGAAAEREVDATVGAIGGTLQPFIFGEGDDTLAAVAIRALVARKETLAVVESCTGGMLGEVITAVPGASEALLGGWITYSNQLKTTMVGVPEALLQAQGAVSEQVARAMAEGGLARSGADHALAITGVAGPGGGTPAKAVGTVFIGHAWRGPKAGCRVRRFLIGGGRAEVRSRSAMSALAMLHFALKEGEVPRLVWEIPLEGLAQAGR